MGDPQTHEHDAERTIGEGADPARSMCTSATTVFFPTALVVAVDLIGTARLRKATANEAQDFRSARQGIGPTECG
jgi:hypothetical protein